MIRAITFDLFDTLVDLHFDRLTPLQIGERAFPWTVGAQHAVLVGRGHGVDLETYARALRESDRELADSHYRQYLEVPTPVRFERVTARLGLDDPGLPAALTEVHMGSIVRVAETPPHHVDVLADLSRRYRLGLCSNFSHADTALTILSAGGLDRYLSAIAISDTARFRKPRREIFVLLLEELGVEPEEAVHVGDRLLDDVAGASAVGMRTIWMKRRVSEPESALAEYDGPRPTWVASDLGEIAALIAGA